MTWGSSLAKDIAEPWAYDGPNRWLCGDWVGGDHPDRIRRCPASKFVWSRGKPVRLKSELEWMAP